MNFLLMISTAYSVSTQTNEGFGGMLRNNIQNFRNQMDVMCEKHMPFIKEKVDNAKKCVKKTYNNLKEKFMSKCDQLLGKYNIFGNKNEEIEDADFKSDDFNFDSSRIRELEEFLKMYDTKLNDKSELEEKIDEEEDKEKEEENKEKEVVTDL